MRKLKSIDIQLAMGTADMQQLFVTVKSPFEGVKLALQVQDTSERALLPLHRIGISVYNSTSLFLRYSAPHQDNVCVFKLFAVAFTPSAKFVLGKQAQDNRSSPML